MAENQSSVGGLNFGRWLRNCILFWVGVLALTYLGYFVFFVGHNLGSYVSGWLYDTFRKGGRSHEFASYSVVAFWIAFIGAPFIALMAEVGYSKKKDTQQ